MGSNCGLALGEMKKIFEGAGIEYTEIVIGDKSIRAALPVIIAKGRKCVFDDEVNRRLHYLTRLPAWWWPGLLCISEFDSRHSLTGYFSALLTRP